MGITEPWDQWPELRREPGRTISWQVRTQVHDRQNFGWDGPNGGSLVPHRHEAAAKAAMVAPGGPVPSRCHTWHVMGTVTEVRIARRTGFCYGVREAIDYAKLAASQGKRTHTLGQVVHNEGVIAELQGQGIRTVDTLDDVAAGAAVVIRAHGVTPEVMARADARGLEVIDGTCTWVIQEQKELARLVEDGYTIVLLGTPNHPEVVGLLGFAPDAIVVDEEEDWERIPKRKRMALISQSTQPPWKFEKLAAHMVSRCHELKVVNTVCPVTIRRQDDTMALAEQVDLVVVVGGRNSANTKELTRLVGISGRPAIQIENARDLSDPVAFEGRQVVGVTGGTSTPIEDLEQVAQRIYELAGTDEGRARAAELAHIAVTAVAESAYRSTSIAGAA
jgi:(E)-4-hydroxy-3-methyl-but-2-enyl pyrophosphate reductase